MDLSSFPLHLRNLCLLQIFFLNMINSLRWPPQSPYHLAWYDKFKVSVSLSGKNPLLWVWKLTKLFIALPLQLESNIKYSHKYLYLQYDKGFYYLPLNQIRRMCTKHLLLLHQNTAYHHFPEEIWLPPISAIVLLNALQLITVHIFIFIFL